MGMARCTKERAADLAGLRCMGSPQLAVHVQGHRSGLGMYAFALGDCYWGSWRQDAMEGLGVYQHHEGQIYEGMWRSGCKHGWGVMTNVNGRMWASTPLASDAPQGLQAHAMRVKASPCG